MFGWLRAGFSRIQSTTNRGLTLVPSWLANVKWLISTKFLPLAQQAYGQNEVVFACLRLLSQSVPEAPLIAYQRNPAQGTKTPVEYDHALAKLIRQPNPLMTEYEFWELTTLHMAIVGRSTWWKQRNNDGTIRALWPLRPDRVGPYYSDSMEEGKEVLWGWTYQLPGAGDYVLLPRHDVLSFNFPDPTGESGGIVEGFGPLQVLAKQVASDNEATKFVGALLANYAAPTVALKIKSPIRNEAEANLIKAKFRQEFGGSNRGTPALLDADTDITIIGFNLQQLEFPELRNTSESRIAAALGVPAILAGLKVGLQMGNNRASVTEQRAYFAETTLSNYWRRYQDQYTLDIATEFGADLMTDFNTLGVHAMAAHFQQKIAPVRNAFKDGAATRNEYRNAIGLPLLPPMKGDIFVIPMNMQELLTQGHQRITDESLVEEETDQVSLLPEASPQEAATTGGDQPLQPMGVGDKPVKANYDYGTTQFNLNGSIGKAIITHGDSIPDNDLAADGRETEPHITVKYGIKTAHRDAVAKLKEALVDQSPITVKFGYTALFSGDGYDVLIVEVDGEELQALHDKIGSVLDTVDTHPTYQPHATVAYVKPEVSYKYVGMDYLNGKEATLSQLTVSSKGQASETIQLTGSSKAIKAWDDVQEEAEALIAALLALELNRQWDKAIEAVRNGEAFDYEGLALGLTATLEPELARLALEQILRDAADMTIGVDVAEVSVMASEWARDYVAGLVAGLIDTTRGVIEEAARKYATLAGMTEAELRDALEAAFGASRIEGISITEVTRARDNGTAIYAVLLGVLGVKVQAVYHTARDERVCPLCSPLDGRKERDAGFARPPRHPYCRCYVTLEVVI